MLKNVGSVDKIFRLVVGVALLALPFVSGLAAFEGAVPVAISVIAGVVLIATAVVNFCPVYRLLGIRTTSKV